MMLGISALGVVFPGGSGDRALLDALRAGRALLAPSRHDPGVLAGEIGAGLKDLVRRKGLASLSRSALLAAAAIEDLLASAPDLSGERLRRCALVSGTAFGHVASKAEFHAAARRDGVRLVSPIVFPNTLINSLAGHAAILFGVKGPNSTVASGRRSGLEAILRAGSLMAAGRAERVIGLGCDEVSAPLLRALAGSGALAGGIRPGEAAAALLLEDPRDLAASGRRPRGTILGSAEASAVGRELSVAVEEAMGAALEAARVSPGQVSWVATSAGGGEDLDRAELDAVGRLLGGEKPLAAPKAMFGETFGAAGMLSAAVAVVSMEAGIVPPTPGAASVSSPGGFAPAPRPSAPGPVLVSSVEEDGATCVVVGA